MSELFLIISIVMALVLGVAGVIALVAGRVVLPWNGKVRQARVWGAGALLAAVGLATARLVTYEVTVPLLLGGLLLQFLAEFFGGRRARQAE
ncbi:hypothetical protein AB0G74_03125 [Streptomyces sp. NPDC020875]|uniref:hypothetical protein n=1 Tax=Streptomyces sp. NPDC020875 TaxID=3154898 RepID=UPI0033DE64B9